MRRQLRTLVNQSSKAISSNISSWSSFTRRDHDRSDATSGVFEVSLSDHLKVSGRDISIVLESCIAFLLDCVNEEGLFRVPGSTSEVRRLKMGFDTGLADLNDRVSDPHAVAGTLKLYLRELPEPLLTFNLYPEWIEAARMNEHEDRLCAMKETIQKLPKAHFDNLRYLMKFLQHLSKFTTSNKMTPQNIAMAIAPSLIWAPNNSNSTPAIDMAATNLHSLIVYNLVESAQTLFPEDVNLTTMAQFSQSERFNGSTKSTCDQSNGDAPGCTLQPPSRTKRIKKLAPKVPSSIVSSLRKSPSPSPGTQRRSMFLRNNNDYEKLTNGSSCKQLTDYSSSESTDQDVSGISYRVNEFDTASLDRKIVLRSRTTDRATVQARRNSNRRSVSNVQRPNVPPPQVPTSNSSLSKPRSSDDLLNDCHGRTLDESMGSLCINSTIDPVDSTVDSAGSSSFNPFDPGQGVDHSLNQDLPCEPPKKPPRKAKTKPNHKSISVVEVTPPPEDKVDEVEATCQVQNSSSFDSKSEDISIEETPRVNILDESSSLKVASSSSSSLLCTEDVIDDEVLTQDIPPPPMIPPPPPPPPSTPYDATELENNLIVEYTPLVDGCSGFVDVKVKPPKPPPPPKPKAYQANAVIEKSYL